MADRRSRVPKLVEVSTPAQVRAVALVLPGGFIKSRGRYLGFVEWGLRPLSQQLTAAGAAEGLAVWSLRYRVRGWNGAAADGLADTRWALDRIREKAGDVPVLLVGNSMGGRAAALAADDPQVAGLVGIAPWLPADDAVAHLAGREVLIMHGDQDRSDASAAMSLEWAQRVREVVPELARFEIPGAGHFLLKGTTESFALCTEFAMSVLFDAPRGELLEKARGGDLRMPAYRLNR